MNWQASTWLGNAIGSGIGLIALLIGALLNASLNRRRDDRMRDERRDAIAAAVAAEYAGIADAMVDCFGFMAQYVAEGRKSHSLEAAIVRCRPPRSLVVEKLGADIGLLEPDMARKVVQHWYHIGLIANLMETTAEELRADQVVARRIYERNGHAQDLAVKLHDLAKELAGLETGHNAPKRHISAQEMRDMLARKPGQDAVDAEAMTLPKP